MSRNYPPPKVPPDVVVEASLQAVVNCIENIYPGEQATNLAEQLTDDPKAVEKQFASLLPT